MKRRSDILELKKGNSAAEILPASTVIPVAEEVRTSVQDLSHGALREPDTIAQRKGDLFFQVSEDEFEGLETLISDIRAERKIFGTLWPLLAGLASSSVLNLFVTRVHTIVWDLSLVLLLTSVVLSITFLILDIAEPKKVSSSKEASLRKLQRIRDKSHKPAHNDDSNFTSERN